MMWLEKVMILEGSSYSVHICLMCVFLHDRIRCLDNYLAQGEVRKMIEIHILLGGLAGFLTWLKTRSLSVSGSAFTPI